MKITLRLFCFLFIALSCGVAFWLGTQTVSLFSGKSSQIETLPSENPNRSALRAVARRGFVFERDMEKGSLKQAVSQTLLRHFERNLKSVLVHHQTERQKFHVTLRCSIAIPGGTPEQIGNYRRLMIAGELATTLAQKQAIEKEKKRVLNGAKVAPTIHTSSFRLNSAR